MDTQITRICAGVNICPELFLKYRMDELIKIRGKKIPGMYIHVSTGTNE